MPDDASVTYFEMYDAARRVQAEKWLTLCVHYAKRWCLLENPERAVDILTSALIWIEEANRQMDQAVAAQLPPRLPRGKTGGVQ